MKFLVTLCALVALIAEITEGCNPATWTAREKEIYRCMRGKGWSNPSLRAFYNSVMKPGAGGRATCAVQQQVQGCMTMDDFRYYGIPDDCTPQTPPPQPQERIVYVYITSPVVTSAPAVVTAAPPVVTSAPVVVTAAPPVGTSAPVFVTSAPPPVSAGSGVYIPPNSRKGLPPSG